MTIFDALILGVVEGITEFLPVSSTGHMIMVATLLHLQDSDTLKSFEIIVQLGAIAAVAVVYFKRFFDIRLLMRLFVAFLPTGIIGVTLYPIFKEYLLGNAYIVAAALFVGGLVLIAFEYLRPSQPTEQDLDTLTYTQCALIGLCQAVAIIPGVSRSAATIIGGQLLGMGRLAIVEFSFLLAVPTMVAATGYDVLKNINSFKSSDIGLFAIGLIVSFLVALACIRFFLDIIRRYSFIPFGIYRIIAAIVFVLLIN